jgi:hypothetical protein
MADELAKEPPEEYQPLACPILTSEEILAVNMRLEGESNGSIAERVGVSRQAVSQWFAKPKIRQALSSAITARREALGHQLEGAATAAVTKLQELMRGGDDVSKAVQLGAAAKILDTAVAIAGLDAPLKLANADGTNLREVWRTELLVMMRQSPEARQHLIALAELSVKTPPALPAPEQRAALRKDETNAGPA